MKDDIAIARAATPRPIREIAEALGIAEADLAPHGHYKAKVGPGFTDRMDGNRDGHLVLVTAMTPTPAGEGKTTTTVGLGDALNRLDRRAAICLREPSLGPCFGMKGGAAGGGRSQVIPMEDINLHFTGDSHAITSANNLLSALLDNHIYWDNAQGVDPRRPAWRRVLDLNDRALRSIITALGGVANGFPREGGMDITAASEVMAVLCLAHDIHDLQRRLGNIITARRRDRSPVLARELQADGAMAALLKDALQPNLVQTLEHTPAFVHGGPFANIAHGCNSLMATRTALKTADYVVTEAGFGADLGAEKFFNIKCRKGGLKPSAAVVVATVRGLKYQGGAARDQLDAANPWAVRRGCPNLTRHLRNVKAFGVPAVVAVNRFADDTDAELDVVLQAAREAGAEAVVCTHFDDGGAGAEALADAVAGLVEHGRPQFAPLYSSDETLWDKARTVATHIYEAEDIMADKAVRDAFAWYQEAGYGEFPVCMAKTPYSFSTDPNLRGAPSHHHVAIRELRLSAGAEFLVALCGDIMTMPGLPREPAAASVRIDENGEIEGLF